MRPQLLYIGDAVAIDAHDDVVLLQTLQCRGAGGLDARDERTRSLRRIRHGCAIKAVRRRHRRCVHGLSLIHISLLSEEERQHSSALADVIRTRIAAAGGWLPFDAFMELALYAPGLGYYSAGAVKLGVGGDFVTAPEMSRLFGQCLARQCAEVLSLTGGGILEFGAGTGAMAVTVMEELARLRCV